MTHDKESREAMAEPFCPRERIANALSEMDEMLRLVEQGMLPKIPLAWSLTCAKVRLGKFLELYDKLGPKAVGAIMAGEATVIGLNGQDCKLLGESAMNEKWIVIKASSLDTMFRRLDTPSGDA